MSGWWLVSAPPGWPQYSFSYPHHCQDGVTLADGSFEEGNLSWVGFSTSKLFTLLLLILILKYLRNYVHLCKARFHATALDQLFAMPLDALLLLLLEQKYAE
jgi:hypothetical protein